MGSFYPGWRQTAEITTTKSWNSVWDAGNCSSISSSPSPLFFPSTPVQRCKHGSQPALLKLGNLVPPPWKKGVAGRLWNMFSEHIPPFQSDTQTIKCAVWLRHMLHGIFFLPLSIHMPDFMSHLCLRCRILLNSRAVFGSHTTILWLKM